MLISLRDICLGNILQVVITARCILILVDFVVFDILGTLALSCNSLVSLGFFVAWDMALFLGKELVFDEFKFLGHSLVMSFIYGINEFYISTASMCFFSIKITVYGQKSFIAIFT
uniref:Uncharacterized protein n=1 Tax=Manihot esculenta TaxID=3983 RepID=A0A2C9WFK6_MANES